MSEQRREDATGTLDVVQKRWRVLERVADGPVAKPDLVATLDVSRSTVDRAIRDLESQSLVEREGGTVAATLGGRLAWVAFRRFRDRLDAVSEAGSLLPYLDPDCGLDVRVLAEASVHVAEGPAPYRPTEVLEELVESAERIRGLSVSISDSSSAQEVHDAVVERGVDYEVVFADEVARFLRTERRAERRRMVESGTFRAFRTGSLPFGLFVFRVDNREVVTVVVYDEDTGLRGVILNDTDRALAWARSYYRSVRADAEEITDWFRA